MGWKTLTMTQFSQQKLAIFFPCFRYYDNTCGYLEELKYARSFGLYYFIISRSPKLPTVKRLKSIYFPFMFAVLWLMTAFTRFVS